jgi:anti-sigma factor RsiW
MREELIDPRKDKLIAFLYGELSDADAREVEKMLAEDLELRREFEELREMRSLLGEWEIEEKTPGFVLVDTEASSGRRAGGVRPLGTRGLAQRIASSRAWWGLAAAACLLIVLGASGFRIERVNGGVAFRFGGASDVRDIATGGSGAAGTARDARTAGGAPSGSGSTDEVQLASTDSQPGPSALDRGASHSGSSGSHPDSRPNPAGGLVAASNGVAPPKAGAAPAAGQGYMTRQEFESYSDGMSKMFVALLKDYGETRDKQLADAMQAMYTGLNDQQFKDYQELRKRIEAINVELTIAGADSAGQVTDALEKNGEGVPLEPRGTSKPRSEDD